MRAAPLGAVLLLLAACGAPPPSASSRSSAPEGKPSSSAPSRSGAPEDNAASPPPPASVDRLMAEGEFLQARRRAMAEGNQRIVRLIETRAGVRGRPAETLIHERVAVYEVLNHLSTGERLFREGKHEAAAIHLERGLAEIQRYGLQRRFPSALRNRVQTLLGDARR